MGLRLQTLQIVARLIEPKPARREALFVEALYTLRLTEVLRAHAVNCVLDVGANRGQFAKRLRNCGYTDWIVSFEPIPELYQHLQRIAQADGRWQVHPFALGSVAGATTFHITAQDDFSSMLEPNAYAQQTFGLTARASRDITVEVRRLESMLGEFDSRLQTSRYFLKLDTQGFDLEVFKGLGARQGSLAGIQSELSLIPIYKGMPSMYVALETYQAAGYGITGLYPVNVEPSTGRVIEYDCILVPSAGRM